MTNKLSESSKNLIKIYINKPNIRPAPSGISSLYFFLLIRAKKRLQAEPKNKIGARARGPASEPIPPNKIKSPPPIPSFFLIILYTKFIAHRVKKPNINPKAEYINDDLKMPNSKPGINKSKILLETRPIIPIKIFKLIGK